MGIVTEFLLVPLGAVVGLAAGSMATAGFMKLLNRLMRKGPSAASASAKNRGDGDRKLLTSALSRSALSGASSLPRPTGQDSSSSAAPMPARTIELAGLTRMDVAAGAVTRLAVRPSEDSEVTAPPATMVEATLPADESWFEDLPAWLAPGAPPDSGCASPPVPSKPASHLTLIDPFDDSLSFDGDLFDAAHAHEATEPVSDAWAPPDEDDLTEVREMFDSIAAVYVRPVRQFLSRLSAGPVAAEWAEICAPAVGMVSHSALSMGLEPLAKRLESFRGLLCKAGEDDAFAFDGDARATILQAAEELRQTLPQAFSPESDGDQRDNIILHSLLQQVPEVGQVTIDKVLGAGLTLPDVLEHGNAACLSTATGISERLSEHICAFLQRYCQERDARKDFDSPKAWLRALGPIVDVLEEHHSKFQRYENSKDGGPGRAQDRRLHRRGRQDASLQLEVLLAEMGEVQMVDELQRLTFEGRIKRLRGFLSSLAQIGEP